MNSGIPDPAKESMDTFSQLLSTVFGVILNLLFITESQNISCWKEPLGDYLVQSSCREQSQLEQVYEDCVPLGFERPK